MSGHYRTWLNNYFMQKQATHALDLVTYSRGPSDGPRWTAEYKVSGEVIGTGVADSKASAKEMAAKNALQNLGVIAGVEPSWNSPSAQARTSKGAAQDASDESQVGAGTAVDAGVGAFRIGPRAQVRTSEGAAQSASGESQVGTRTVGLGEKVADFFQHDMQEDIQTAASVIYLPGNDSLPRPKPSLSPDDMSCLESKFDLGGCLLSVHDSTEAVAWIEHNWEISLLTSIRARGCNGPLAFMLFPTTPALALFGSYKDHLMSNFAELLAKTSGFPVVIRPLNDSPIALLSGDNIPGKFNQGTELGETAFNSESKDLEPTDGESVGPVRGGGSTARGQGDGGGNPGSGKDGFGREGDRDGSDPGGFPFREDGDGGDGDGDKGGAGLEIGDKWESPLHGTCVKLRLKLKSEPAKYYLISISHNFKFHNNPDNNPSVDRDNLTTALSQSGIIALVDFKIENRPCETQVDRSYATIGIVAYREKSIMQREIIPRGFDLPDQTFKHERQVYVQKGVKTILGFASGHPTATATFSYDKNSDSLVEATDNKIMPRCLVRSEIGHEWDKPGKSYTSYHFAYQPHDVQLGSERSEPSSLQVKVGMGINLRPPGLQEPRMSFVNQNQVLIWVSDPASKSRIRGIVVLMSSYVDDIRRAEQLSIYEQKDVKLMNTEPGENDLGTHEDNEAGTISLLITKVPPPTPNKFGAAAWIPKLGQRNPRPPTDLPLDEYLARGWDADNEEWREVLWPALEQHFRAAEFEHTSPAWNLQWQRAQGANVRAEQRKGQAQEGKDEQGKGQAQEGNHEATEEQANTRAEKDEQGQGQTLEGNHEATDEQAKTRVEKGKGRAEL